VVPNDERITLKEGDVGKELLVSGISRPWLYVNHVFLVADNMWMSLQHHNTREVAVQKGEVLDELASLIAGGIAVEAVRDVIVGINLVQNRGSELFWVI